VTFTPWLTALVLSTLQPNGLPQGALERLGQSPLRLGPVFVAISADNQRIRTITQEGFVRIFDAKSGEMLASRRLLTPREDNVYYGGNQGFTGMTTDGAYVIIQDSSDYNSRGVRVIDIETGKVKLKYPQNPGNDWIAGSTISPDGKKLLVYEYGNGNPRHTLVDVVSGTSRNLIEPQNAGVVISTNMMHFSPDSKTAIILDPNGGGAGGMKGTCYVVEDGKKLWTETLGMIPKFSLDSKQVYTMGQGKTLGKILDAKTGKAITGKLPSPKDVVSTPILGAKGEVFYPLLKGGIARWDSTKGEQSAVIPAGIPSHGTQQAALAHDGSFLITAFHGNLCRWDLPKGDRVFGEPSPLGSATPVGRVIFSPDGKKLFSLGEGDSHGIWDRDTKGWTATPRIPAAPAKNNAEQEVFWGGTPASKSVVYTAAGPRYLSGGWSSNTEVFDGITGKSIAKLSENNNAKGAQEASYYGNGILTTDGATAVVSRTSYNGNETKITVEKWDVATGTKQHKVELSAGNYTPYSSISPCGRFAFLGSKVLYLNNGSILFGVNKNEQQQNYYYGGTSLFSPDGRILATTTSENQRDYGQQTNDLYLWDGASGIPMRKLSWRVSGVTFSPNSRLIAISNPKGVKVFDVQTGKELLHARAPDMRNNAQYYDGSNGAVAVAFSSDNLTLATGHTNGTVTLWKVPPVEKLVDVKPELFDKVWDEFATQDAATTRTMTQQLKDHPATAIKFLQAKFVAPPLPPLTIDPNALIRQLDSPVFSDRYAAYRKLKEYGPRVRRVLEENLQKTESVEVRSKLEELLSAQNTMPLIEVKGQHLRAMRMFEVLETLGTPEAKQLLLGWSEQTSNLRLMHEAKLSLARCAK
jgi:WD40 repeat protein